MSYYEEETHKRPKINSRLLGQHQYSIGIKFRNNATLDELKEDGWQVVANVDGTEFCWMNEKRFDNFMSGIHIHKKQVTNIIRLNNDKEGN